MPVIDWAAVAFRSWRIAKQVMYGGSLVFLFTMLGAALVAFVSSFFTFYNAFDSFIANLGNYGGGDTLSKFFGLLSCIGFTQALSDTKSIISSSLVFLLARIVSAQFIYFYFIVLRVIAPLVK